MIPFRMQCPGCQAKVVVKHQELLGKSLPCPKCKHLIVVPSQGPISNLSGVPVREPAPSFDSTAITKEDYGDWEEVLSNLPQNPLGIDPEQIDWTTAEPNGPATDSTIPFQPLETSPPLPSSASDWQNKNVKKRRQLLLVATIAILSSLLAGIGFFSFLSFMRSDETAQVRPDPPTTDSNGLVAEGGQPADGKAADINDKGNVLPEDADPAKDSQESPPSESESPKNETQPPSKDGVDSGPVVIPSTNSSDANSAPNDKGTNPDANAVNPNQETTEGVAATDGANKTEETDASTSNETSDAIYKLPPELARVRDLLNNSRGSVGSDSGFRPPPSIDELDLENLQYPQMDIFHPEAKTLGDWKQVSMINIPRMNSPNDVPLSMGLEEFARLTNVGITIDWKTCRALGIEANPIISMKLENKVIAGFIDETLSAKGLSLRLDPKGFPIVRPNSPANNNGEMANGATSANWVLKDVCAEGFEKETADLLISMYEIKDHCNYVDGALMWNESAPLLEKAKLYDTLRHLSKISGKPSPAWAGTEQFQAMQFSVEAWRDSRDTLAKTLPDTAFLSESRPAISILQGAARMVDAQIIVDWKSAWGHGLTPTEESISVLRNRTLAQIAKKILIEYALEMIPIDSRTFWLTTGRVRQTDLIVVPIKPPVELNMDLVKRTLSKLRPLGIDGLSRFQMRPVPGMDGVYFARVCPPNTNIIQQEEFASIFSWP